MRERMAQMVIDHPERIPALQRARERIANGEIRFEVEEISPEEYEQLVSRGEDDWCTDS